MIDVRFAPEFKRNLRILAKKYRHIRDDVDPVIEALQAGETLGDQIPGVGYTLFKVRVPNQDSAKGKSGGYRIIYYLRTSQHHFDNDLLQDRAGGYFSGADSKYRW